ncbi:MAG: M48 family metallopeptidase [Elusimicrobiales bacterium]|nr:M48 family metallopeptidase [Elusimicrobiales bacterium]
MSVAGVCRDVKDFLRALAGDLPEVFPRPAVYRPRRGYARRRAGAPGPTAAQRRAAREIISARVAHWAAALGVEYKRVFIKNQRSMWGSCSMRRNLNFNWRLAAAAPEVLDYVVIHELCHLREMNHSKKFWAHVGAACPEYKARRRWLRDNTALLRRTDILN